MKERFKFRAKRLDNNKFVYGYLCFIYIDNEKHCRIYSLDDAMSYDCYTETLGQCTGLKDKNGKLIYEGDILNSLYRSDGCKGLYIIVWCEGRLVPEKFGNHQQKQVTVHLTDLKWCEVIGNIHENADLLENNND